MTCPFSVWQGGGLDISGGDVTLNNCDIHHNRAHDVSAPPPPRKKFPDADETASLLSLLWQGGGIHMPAGRLLLANQTLLANNTATGRGDNFLATGGEALYQLPAPPGRWIAGVRCIVFRNACPGDNSAAARACQDSREACSERPDPGPDVTADGCQDATFLQPCNWQLTPELIGQTIQVLPMGGDGIDDVFPYGCATGVRGSADLQGGTGWEEDIEDLLQEAAAGAGLGVAA